MSRRVDEHLAEQLQRTPDPEVAGVWPTERLQCLIDAGIFRWGLPEEFGGLALTDLEMLEGYLELSRHCLTTAFILTQRNAACHRIATCENESLRRRLLPEHCAGRSLATVGISHLSTSRQHWARPSVLAIRTENGFEISGEAPWVTGANHADLLVTGATMENGHQILVAIPTDRTGVSVNEPLKLLALNASQTGSVMLAGVRVGDDEILAGPCPQVMKIGTTGGTGSLTTTAVAIGVAQQTIERLQVEAETRVGIASVVHSLANELNNLRNRLHQAASDSPNGDPKLTAEELRFSANSLVTRTAQAFSVCAKGAGFIAGHPAERAIREAAFFHVWSCPPAVTEATLTKLT